MELNNVTVFSKGDTGTFFHVKFDEKDKNYPFTIKINGSPDKDYSPPTVIIFMSTEHFRQFRKSFLEHTMGDM